MYTKDKRRSRDAQRTTERLYYKFLSSYVEARHNEIHEEGLALFRQAKRENPGVKDLTKTDTYMKRAHPGVPIPKYYTSRKRRPSSSAQPQGCTTQMVLNIPLLPPRPITCSSPPEVSTSPPPPPEVSTQSSPPPPEVSTQSSQPEVTTSPPEVSMQPEVSTLPVLSPEIYQDLLAELRSDPELWKCLNDFPIEDNAMDDFVAEDAGDMNDFVVKDMGDIVFDDVLTPLEIEVETAFDN